MEDHIITQDSVKSCGLAKEDEREKVKDFVYRHLMNDRAVLNKGHCRAQQGAVFSGKILSFGCSECKDSSTYSPNDLLKHFRAAHCGTLPTYPCDLCGFVTNEFAVLQRHRIEHRDTLVTCELCHDGVQYSLLLLTRHYNMCHSLNGQFTCHWCQFTTVDAGTFVQHIHHHKATTWECAKCSHISLNEEQHQKHLKSHTGTFPFTCPMCGYGCARNDYLKKHMAAVHKSEKKSVWTAIEDNGAPLNSPASLKLLLKKTSPPSGESKEDNQIAKVSIGPGVKANTIDRIVLSNEIISEPHLKVPDTLSQKQTLSPPNCTTKVIGFKMVDGKKHLVLKVIQASKQDDCAQPDPREYSTGKNSTLDCLQADDIMTVKVKVEEEETTVSSLDSSPKGAAFNNDLNLSPFSDGHLMLKNCDKNSSPHQQIACSQRTVKDRNTAQFSVSMNLIESSQPANTVHVDNSEVADAIVLSHTLTPEKHALTGQTTSDTSANKSDKNGQDNVAVESSNFKVFTFHNYSKETTSSSPDFGHSSFELSAEREVVSPEFNLTLAESPDPGNAIRQPAVDESMCGQRNSECSSNVEVDGCVSDVEVEENPESVLQDFNIIKIEEDNIPITKPPSNHLSPATNGFVNEHCNTFITQQPNKESTESAGSENTDATKQTKRTVRILQLPEGKQPVLLRTAADSRFAVPVQVNAPPGFKLITNSTNPHINVSYMKSAGEKTSNSGVLIGSNSKVVGVPTGKGALLTSSKQGITSSSNHYLITSDYNHPLLLPRVLNGTPSDKTKTCYVVQRSSLPVVQSPPAPGLKLSGTQLSLNPRPLLAVPVTSAESPGNLQSGRQTFLLRYVPPTKSGLTVSSQETKVIKPAGPCTQTNDSSGNKLIFKIVSPPNSTLSNASPVSQNHPVLLATRPQAQCFLLSSNNPTTGIKKFFAVQNSSQNIVSEARVVHSSVNMKSSDVDKRVLAPRPIRPPSQRKRRRKLLFDELPVTNNKVRKLSNKTFPEKEPDLLWSPVAKDKERTLRLSPQSSDQQVKWPRKYQPVVVLNHPDVDIPEVASIMKVVQRHQGAVTKVSLSQKTIQALNLSITDSSTKDKSQSDSCHPRTVQSLVRERYLLKLKLKRKNKKKYRLVRTVPNLQQPVEFTCWFCGRLFNSQEAWIGHGQRHLLEATRDWNTLV
uniref:Si:ch211-214e3.5 n=1 Tax=Neogobius melanostomus TaxID=47308 RepID=A0A8C6WPF5_9GOBI